MGARRRLLGAVAAIAALLVLAEVATAAFFEGFATDRLSVHWRIDAQAELAQVDEQRLRAFMASSYDWRSGWLPYGGAFSVDPATGARVDPLGLPLSGVRAYGDSFTYCEDVDDDETWPHLLGRSLQGQVLNFGVPGGSPDQGLARLLAHLEDGARPDVVVLGILSENIARVVNRHRLLYAGSRAVLAFKPMLEVSGKPRGRWLDNPLPPEADGRDDLLAAGRRAVDGDYWHAYNRTRPERPSFPYLTSLVDTLDYLVRRVERWQALWQQERPLRTMEAVVTRFADAAREHGFTPVVVMIPMGDDVRRREDGQAWSYRDFVRRLRGRADLDHLRVIDVLETPFDGGRFHLSPYAGHASPYGNDIVSAAVAAAL